MTSGGNYILPFSILFFKRNITGHNDQKYRLCACVCQKTNQPEKTGYAGASVGPHPADRAKVRQDDQVSILGFDTFAQGKPLQIVLKIRPTLDNGCSCVHARATGFFKKNVIFAKSNQLKFRE